MNRHSPGSVTEAADDLDFGLRVLLDEGYELRVSRNSGLYVAELRHVDPRLSVPLSSAYSPLASVLDLIAGRMNRTI